MAYRPGPCDLDQLADPPWERAAGETAKAFAGFTDYLENGTDRTLKAVAHATRPYDTIITWSRRWRWTYRADAWDRHVAAARRARYLAEHEDMARRHARQAQGLLEVATQPALMFLRRLRDDRTVLGELEMMSVRELLSLAAQTGRLIPALQAAEAAARGVDQATANAGNVHIIDVEYGADHMATVAATLIELGVLPAPAETDTIDA